MQFPILIELRRSTVYQVLLTAVHAVAALSVWYLPCEGLWRVVGLVLVFASVAVVFRSPGIVGLQLTATELRVRTSNGLLLGATLRPGCTVFRGLAVLRLDCEGEAKSRSLVLFPDSFSGDDFRMLRLWLRWSAQSGRNAGSAS